MIIITHEHNEALALAQRVAVIQEGAVVQIGTPQEVFTHPQNAFVADFTGAETIWHGEVVECRDGLCTVRTRAGIPVETVADVEVGRPVVLAIRPEDVALAPAGAAAPASYERAQPVVRSGRQRHPGRSSGEGRGQTRLRARGHACLRGRR